VSDARRACRRERDSQLALARIARDAGGAAQALRARYAEERALAAARCEDRIAELEALVDHDPACRHKHYSLRCDVCGAPFQVDEEASREQR